MLSLHGGAPIRRDHATGSTTTVGTGPTARSTLNTSASGSAVDGCSSSPRAPRIPAPSCSRTRPADLGRDRGHRAYGFYWTEGNRGLGWGHGVTPTLKGGSNAGHCLAAGGVAAGADVGRRHRTSEHRGRGAAPGIPRLDGPSHVRSEGVRWKLVGNAVTVPVAAWVGSRSADPGEPLALIAARPSRSARVGPLQPPLCGEARDLARRVSDRSPRQPAGALDAVLTKYGAMPLSLGATRGFATRLEGQLDSGDRLASSLRLMPTSE